MAKKVIIILFFSMLIGIKNSYAVIDPMAQVQSVLELAKELKNKANEIEKQKRDLEKRVKQGFEAGKGCFSNPMKCDVGAYKALGVDAAGFVKGKIKDIKVMPGSVLKEGDLIKKASQGLMENIQKTYIYKRGQGKDINNLHTNRQNNNAIVTDELATMFAKGITTRNSIQAEDGKLYKKDFEKDNIEEILYAQNVVTIFTDSRLARILELRAYMVGAEATAELTQQSREATEEE